MVSSYEAALQTGAEILVRSLDLQTRAYQQAFGEAEARTEWLIDRYAAWSAEGTFTFPDGYTMQRRPGYAVVDDDTTADHPAAEGAVKPADGRGVFLGGD